MKQNIALGLSALLGLLGNAAAAPALLQNSNRNTDGFIALESQAAGKAHETGGDEYIVLFKPDHPNTRKRAVMPHISDVLRTLDLKPEDSDVKYMYTGGTTGLRGFAANMKSHCLDILEAMDDVDIVEKVQDVYLYKDNAASIKTNAQGSWGQQALSGVPSAISTPEQFNHQYRTLANSTLGQGVDAYIVDSGVNTDHKAFGGRADMESFVPDQPTDGDGHGTHVAATLGGDQFGMAPGTKIHGVKVMNNQGVGRTSSIMAGLQSVISRHNAAKAKPGFVASVVNLSLGGAQSAAFDKAVGQLSDAGIHVVVAAGNENDNACSYSPSHVGGANGNIITVGSISPSYTISTFSNTGTCVDVYAPGEKVVSAWITGDTSTMDLQGTSMASPHVAGLVAYFAALDGTLAGDVGKMKVAVKERAIKGALSGVVKKGDQVLLANNGIR